jgi:putative ABC transport system permease protein
MQVIPSANLALAFIPVALVVGLYHQWGLDSRHSSYAVLRMLVQLLLVGYALTFLFTTNHALVVVAVVLVMILAGSWIALGTLPARRMDWLGYALISMFLGGGFTLLLTTQGVLELLPWYQPRYFIPLAGMIFANAMNSVSLAAERWVAETERGIAWREARRIAFRACLIPITNSLLAVGLVSLPGMMTGQILSGVSPLVAVRYQIMVMCMVYGSAGISAAIFLALVCRQERGGKKEGAVK